jgi:hypothetical protein
VLDGRSEAVKHLFVARRMRDPTFRAKQLAELWLPRIAPINRLVDDLQDPARHLWMPYVAPIYGGVNARLLTVLRDPGPKTNVEHGGSGMLCMENDDPSAERMCELYASVNLTPRDSVPWNSYPWYINARPSARQKKKVSSRCTS